MSFNFIYLILYTYVCLLIFQHAHNTTVCVCVCVCVCVLCPLQHLCSMSGAVLPFLTGSGSQVYLTSLPTPLPPPPHTLKELVLMCKHICTCVCITCCVYIVNRASIEVVFFVLCQIVKPPPPCGALRL